MVCSNRCVYRRKSGYTCKTSFCIRAHLSQYHGIERPCSSSIQLSLASISSNLFHQENISSHSTPVTIEGYILVNDLHTNAWRNYQNWSSTILFLWKVWQLTNSILILLFPPSPFGDINYIFVFTLGFAAFRLKLYIALDFVFGWSVKSCPAFLTLLHSAFVIH